MVGVLLLLLAWEAREDFLHLELSMDPFVRQLVEFSLVSLHVLDEVHIVLRLLELAQILSIDNVAEFIFHLDDKFDTVKFVQTVGLQV